MNPHGRFFRIGAGNAPAPGPIRGARPSGLGELPATALDASGALDLAAPASLPPMGNQQAPTQAGQMAPMQSNQSVWGRVVFNAQLSPQKVQDFLLRKYFLIVNNSTTASIYVGFGYVPNGQYDGLVLPAGVGYEPYSYPVNEIYVIASAADTPGLILYGV